MKVKSLVSCIASLLLLCSFSVSAQQPERKLVSPEQVVFNPHWFMQLQGGAGYTVGEAESFGDLISPAAALNFGYQFSPAFGLRFGASGWQAKGSALLISMHSWVLLPTIVSTTMKLWTQPSTALNLNIFGTSTNGASPDVAVWALTSA